jgi:hypothetical protein
MDRMSDRDFWEEFFIIYRLHPCLWNTKCKGYSDKHIRIEAYSQLVEKCKERFPSADKDFSLKKNVIASGLALGGNSKGFLTSKSLDLRQTTYLCLVSGTMTFSASLLTLKYPEEANRTSISMKRHMMEIRGIDYTTRRCKIKKVTMEHRAHNFVPTTDLHFRRKTKCVEYGAIKLNSDSISNPQNF